MAGTTVTTSAVTALGQALRAWTGGCDGALTSFHRQAESMLAEMERKRSTLQQEVAAKEAALRQCEMRRNHDIEHSCAAEEAAYQRASARLNRCEALVAKARTAVAAFAGRCSDYRAARDSRVNAATAYLSRLENLIAEYAGNAAPASAATSSTVATVTGGAVPGQGGAIQSSAEMPTAINISGGEQIAGVAGPPGPGTVHIDLSAPSSFANVPPVSAPDGVAMREAAAGIVALIGAGGLALGLRQMYLKNAADRLFQDQYGINTTELLQKRGEKAHEYVEAYNNIYRGLQQEVVEVKKEEISGKIESLRDTLEKSKTQELSLSMTETMHQLGVDLRNNEIILQSLTDGQSRPLVPSGLTRIGGLSEDGLNYMLDRMDSPKRFVAISNVLAAADVHLTGDNGEFYQFSHSDDEFYFVSHDGTKMEHQFRDRSTGISHSASGPNAKWDVVTIDGSFDKPTERSFNAPEVNVAEAGATGKMAGMRITSTYFNVKESGAIVVSGINVGLGVEGNASATIGTGGANMGAEISLATAGLQGAYISAPKLQGGVYAQTEVGVSSETSLGLAAGIGSSTAADGTHEIGAKVPFAKFSFHGRRLRLKASDIPESVRERLL